MMSVDPEVKYKEDGGPGIEQCFDVLSRSPYYSLIFSGFVLRIDALV